MYKKCRSFNGRSDTFFSANNSLNLGIKAVKARQRHRCKCSFVSLLWYEFFTIIIVEIADSQQYIEWNVLRIWTAIFYRRGGTYCRVTVSFWQNKVSLELNQLSLQTFNTSSCLRASRAFCNISDMKWIFWHEMDFQHTVGLVFTGRSLQNPSVHYP